MNLIGGEEDSVAPHFPARVSFREGLIFDRLPRFIDFLQQAGMSYWQMLPLVPVSMDEPSPLTRDTSAMAGTLC